MKAKTKKRILIGAAAVILLLGLRRLRLRTGIRLRLLRRTAGMCFGGILCAAAAYASYGFLLMRLPQRAALLLAVGIGSAVYLAVSAPEGKALSLREG